MTKNYIFLVILYHDSFSAATFPSCVLEVSTEEVDEYHSPKDFQLGQQIKLLGRSFLVYDCDAFTKEYYQKNHPEIEVKPTELPKKTDKLHDRKRVKILKPCVKDTKTIVIVKWNIILCFFHRFFT